MALADIQEVAHDSPDLGAPVKIGGKATAAAPAAVNDGDRVDSNFNLTGAQRVEQGALSAATDSITSYFGKASTATLANVAQNASSTTIKTSNSSRAALIVVNDSSAILYLKYGATASTSSYTVAIAASGYWEMPQPIYTGIVDGIWSGAGAGNARVTELEY